MKLIIGLGNPGRQYQNNRHNAGFIILEELKNNLDFPNFEFSNKFNAEISEKNVNGEKIILIKPQTFMNESGKAVKKIMDFYKLIPENIVVIQDDLDINLGEYKISVDSSSAGHNGIENIIQKIGTQNFQRFRVGIEGQEKRKERTVPGDVFVLQDFSPEELETIKKIAGNSRLI